MKTVEIKTSSKSYNVHIGSGLIDRAGDYIAPGRGQTAVIAADSNTGELYARRLADSLSQAGYKPEIFTFPAGEASKTTHTLLNALSFLAESGLTRSDTVFALGGGVTGDLAGLAAALYMRGVGLVQLPTSLLAMVDSSVGGKTAVDLPAGKNLVGAFYQPDLVLCDVSALDTLPPEEYSNGCAEVVKYAAIRDPALLDIIGRADKRAELIARCVGIKSEIVGADELDRGERQLLNFGHTFGHAVEKLSRFTVAHGSAVAIGMTMMTRACVKLGVCPSEALDTLQTALLGCGLPVDADYGSDELFDALLSDKKRSSDSITLVVPERFGRCVLKKATLSEARELLRLGLGGDER